MKTCTILNDTLAWDVAGNYDVWNCIDICLDTLLVCPLVEDIRAVEDIATYRKHLQIMVESNCILLYNFNYKEL